MSKTSSKAQSLPKPPDLQRRKGNRPHAIHIIPTENPVNNPAVNSVSQTFIRLSNLEYIIKFLCNPRRL